MIDQGTLARQVRQYRKNPGCGPLLDSYLAYFKDLKRRNSLAEVIRLAGFRRDGKTVHNHQHLVGKKRLKEASSSLLRHIDEIRRCKSFSDLHDRIAEHTSRVSGFGVLARYDYSLRIGAAMGLLPELVYLHAGAAKGCKALGVEFSGKTVVMEALPKPLRQLEAYHAENFLCIYKDHFNDVGWKPTSCGPVPRGC